MTPYTLQKFLKSAVNHCILIDNMKHNKCNNQMCEKNNAILDRKYNFFKNLFNIQIGRKFPGWFELCGSQAWYLNH